MATAWPTLTRAQCGPDKTVRPGELQKLLDRDECLRGCPITLYVPQTALTVAGWTTLATVILPKPSIVTGMNLQVYINCDVCSGGASGSWRIKSGTNVGTTVAVSGTGRSGPSTFTDDGTVADTITFVIEGNNTAGAGTLTFSNAAPWAWWED